LALLFAVSSAIGGTAARAQDGPPVEGYPQSWPLDDAPALKALAARHGLLIGNAMRDSFDLLPRADLYRQIVSHEFDVTTPESSLKWAFVHPVEGEFDFDRMDDIAGFAATHRLALHGHPLVWHRINPPWLDAVELGRLEAVMTDHIQRVVARYAGRMRVWDVVNEALQDDGPALRRSAFFEAMGEGYIDIAHRTARAADPDAELIYNDFGIGWPTPKSEGMFGLIDRLSERGVPLDGVGFQLHLQHTFNHQEGVSTNMQRVADRGLDVWITEFDVAVLSPDDYTEQATLYEDILKRCLMQPACRAFQIWGLDDFHSFNPFFDPLPFDDRFRPKPAFFALRRALSAEPVHPEQCALDGLDVQSGAVRVAPQRTLASPPVALCEAVRLGPGYRVLRVRYSNGGVDTPTLRIGSLAGEALATLPLTPTEPNDDGAFRTLRVPTALQPTGDTTLRLELIGAAEDVALDGLLFEEPLGAIVIEPPGGETDSAPSARRGSGATSALLLWLTVCCWGRRRVSRGVGAASRVRLGQMHCRRPR